MNFKKETETLLNSLKKIGISRRVIERELDYRPLYIDQLLSKGGNELFLNRLKKYYIEKTTSNGIHGTLELSDTDAQKVIGYLMEKVTKLEAVLSVIEPMVDMVYAKEFGQSVASVGGDRKKAVGEEVQRILHEVQKKFGKR